MIRKAQGLFGTVSPKILGIYRILFGLFMVYEILIYFQMGLIRNMFVLPAINFRYDFFEWVKPLPEVWLNVLMGLLLVCSIAITLGIFFRWSCRLFAAGLLYFLLLDKSIFNNHIYLFILIAFLLSFTDADRIFSLRKKKFWLAQIPGWQVFILQAQIVIVYFYGGIAKINYDWLVHYEPIRSLAAFIPESHFMAGWINSSPGIWLFTFGGLLIDLGAPLFLWFSPVRKWAVYMYILFNGINALIFTDIGIFPFLMLASLMLFYQSGDFSFGHQTKSKKKVKSQRPSPKPVSTPYHTGMLPSPAMRYLLAGYFIFQLTFPLRGYFLPNDMDWTSIGNRFSWRMKVQSRQIEEIRFTLTDGENQQSHPVEYNQLVNPMQILNLATDPRSVADFGQWITKRAEENGFPSSKVYCTIRVRYNGRQPQYFINPEINIAVVEHSPFHRLTWVVPFDKTYP